MRTRILLAEDDPTVGEVVARYLAHDGHDVDWVKDGDTALERALSGWADLLVLDVMLPGVDGLEVCRQSRARGDTPVVLLTALGGESDRVAGFEVGADDYVSKPFSPRELVLRVRAVLRRSAGPRTEGGGVVEDGDLVLDRGARTVSRGGAPLALTTREFDLLAFLMTHPGQVFERQALLEQVWQWDFGDLSTVTVHVRRLRSKVEHDPAAPRRIRTVWGTGYRYDPEVSG